MYGCGARHGMLSVTGPRYHVQHSYAKITFVLIPNATRRLWLCFLLTQHDYYIKPMLASPRGGAHGRGPRLALWFFNQGTKQGCGSNIPST